MDVVMLQRQFQQELMDIVMFQLDSFNKSQWMHSSVYIINLVTVFMGMKASVTSLAAIFLGCTGIEGLVPGQSNVSAARSDVVVTSQRLIHEIEKGVLQHALHQVAKLRQSVE